MKYVVKALISITVLFFITQTTLFAHPGHGDTSGHSLLHYLTEPMHAMVLGAVVLMIAISSTWLMLKMKKRVKERA